MKIPVNTVGNHVVILNALKNVFTQTDKDHTRQ